MYQFSHFLYLKLIKPHTQDPDTHRREFLVNTLLCGLCGIATISVLSIAIQVLSTDHITYDQTVIVVPFFAAFVFTLLWLSRKGFSKYIALFLVGFIFIIASYLVLLWSFMLPMGQLLYIFCVVFAGVLFRARAAILTATICSVIFILLSLLQLDGTIIADTSWLSQPPVLADALGVVLIFIMTGIVTWLADSEIDRALARARASEASLEAERDILDANVKERTRELEKEHLIRIMELQRFAELGKQSASMLHDIANPLTVASLNLGQLSSKKHDKGLVRQVEQSLQYIERYVENARKRLLDVGSIATFSINKEIEQAATILKHHASSHHVRIKTDVPNDLHLTGDPVKFSQIIINLTVNAIEAHDTSSTKQCIVTITCTSCRSGVSISVHDKGRGIPKSNMQHIFTPFYTTKTDSSRNMGLGLSFVKELVEQDYHGTIIVKSSARNGTTFTARLFDS